MEGSKTFFRLEIKPEFFQTELFDNYFFIIYNAPFLAPHSKSVSSREG